MVTTPAQIEAMQAFRRRLEQEPLVEWANLDDWGRFGNFQVTVKPKAHDRHTTNRLKALLRRLMPAGAHLRAAFGPDPIKRTLYGITRLEGYSRSFWVMDVDFLFYDQETNTFAA